MSGKIINLHFSPTGSSRTIGKWLSEALAEKLGLPVEEKDMTTPEHRKKAPVIEKESIIVCAYPVYAGRVPELFANELMKINGNNCLAIPVAVYGNRAFDDALLEAADLLEKRNCKLVAALSAVAQHTFVPYLASGKPDEEEKRKIESLAEKIAVKIKAGSDNKPQIPGNRPYLVPSAMPPIKPLTSDKCNYCGICVKKCPAGVIDSQDEHIIGDGCILCAACVKYCPQKAKSLPQPFLDAVRERLKAVPKEAREPELFL